MNKELELFQMKLLATGLLVAVMALFIIAHSQHGAGGWPWVAAFAEAAMVGALADWFAVVALFKSPMGLPIPHTAIIPHNKAKIADNLATFVRDKFLDVESLVIKVRLFNPAEKLAEWLQRKENTELMGNRIVEILSGALEFVEDDRIKVVLADAIRSYVSKVDLSKSAGNILDTLTADNRHQALLDEGIGLLASWMNEQQTQENIAAYLTKWFEDEYPTASHVLPTQKLGAFAAPKIVSKVNDLLQEIHDDQAHELRGKFDNVVKIFIQRLKHDPYFHRQGEEVKMKLLDDPALNDYLHDLWNGLKDWLRNDLYRKDSVIRQKIIESGQWMGERLASDESLRNAINDHIEAGARKMAPDLAQSITSHISNTVKSWDDAEMSREIELSIGKDLQFIRLNGTIVGGAIGLVIYAISVAI